MGFPLVPCDSRLEEGQEEVVRAPFQVRPFFRAQSSVGIGPVLGAGTSAGPGAAHLPRAGGYVVRL